MSSVDFLENTDTYFCMQKVEGDAGKTGHDLSFSRSAVDVLYF